MTPKKEKVRKFVHGSQIERMDGYWGWVRCTLDTGEKVTISLAMLFKLLDQFDLDVESYGNHFRTLGFESNDNFGKIDYRN
jgi:hypothetical protein